MRTIEEVMEFLASYKIAEADGQRIMGFLLGKELIAKGSIIRFGGRRILKGIATFDDFLAWFENDEEDVLEDLLNFLQDEQDKALEANDVEKANKMATYLGFLVEELELEYEEVREEDLNNEK
jgi:hypothetical protein